MAVSAAHVPYSDGDVPVVERNARIQAGVDVDGEPSEIVMCIVMAKGMLGVSWYDLRRPRLMMSQTHEWSDLSQLQQLKAQYQPSIIVTPTTSDERFLRSLARTTHGNDVDEYEVKMLPSSNFSFDVAKQRLLALPLSDFPDNLDERVLVLGHHVNLELIQMIRAAGGLLSYVSSVSNTLQDHVSAETGNGEGIGVSGLPTIRSLHHVSFEGRVRVDADTMTSLRIFWTEQHPSAHGIGTSKEGLSAYGVLNLAVSPPGKKLLRHWFSTPTTDLQCILHRQEHITAFTLPHNRELVSRLRSALRHVRDMHQIVTKIANVASNVGHWWALFQSLVQSFVARQHCTTADESTEAVDGPSATTTASTTSVFRLALLERLSLCTPQSLFDLVTLINTVIDFDASKAEKRFIVKSGVDKELDDLKHTYAGICDLLTHCAREQMTTLSDSGCTGVDSLTVVYFPQIGYLVVIPLHRTAAVSHDDTGASNVSATTSTLTAATNATTRATETLPGLELQWETTNYAYYKSAIVRQLDVEIGDIHSQIVDLENSIARELEDYVLAEEEHIRALADVCAELDAILALTTAAHRYQLTRPHLLAQEQQQPKRQVIHIIEGRHIVQEQVTSNAYIPNDTHMEIVQQQQEGVGEGEGTSESVHLITGPNGSGKSVYLKQVGLIAYLAHCGSFVPAVSCRMTIVDAIFTRIRSRESTIDQCSSFVGDLRQVATLLRHATDQSLVLIDEFGKGTDQVDGVALMSSLITSLASVRCRSFVVTHFHELIDWTLLPQSTLQHVRHMCMQFTVDTSNERSMVFMFTIGEGRSCVSYGIACAAAAGIPELMLQRAEEVTALLGCGQPVQALSAHREESRMRQYARVVTLFHAFEVDKSDVTAFVRVMQQERLEE